MKKQLVWDLPVRLFHWLLVIALVAQWVTAEMMDNAMDIHFYIGYFLLGLILFRVIWGIFGPRYARFSNFVKGPGETLNYARALAQKKPPGFTGHNPVGGLMVIATLLIVALQGVSGLFITDDVFSNGPYYGQVSQETEKLMSWLHHNLFNAIMAIAAIHIVAIVVYQRILKYDLVKPMLTGKKETSHQNGITSSKLVLALVIALLVAGFVYWLVFMAPPPIEDEYFY